MIYSANILFSMATRSGQDPFFKIANLADPEEIFTDPQHR